jgi:predicted glutamine amidotransferase
MAGNLGHRDKDMLKQMLILCQLRGEDSTGIFYVENGQSEPVSHKVVGDPSNLFETTFWDKMNLYNKSIVVGHCRKATVGGISRFTAHPFTTDHITGVHNGTLRNWRQLKGDDLATDSMTLFKNFAREGGVRENIEQLDGAYALVWYDEETGQLNFLRNNERPLYYAFNEAGDCMYWASEAWMIYMTASRVGIKLMNLTPDEKFPSHTMEVDEDKWWKIRCKNAAKDALVFTAPEELKGGVRKPVYRAPFQNQYTGGYHANRTPFDWESRNKHLQPLTPPATTPSQGELVITQPSTESSTGTESHSSSKDTHSPRPLLSLVQSSKKSGSESSTSESPPSEEDLNDPVPVFDNELKGNGGLVLTKEEFQTLVDPNCIWCKVPHSFEELKGAPGTPSTLGSWIDDDSFICTGCLKTAKINNIC